MPIYFTPINQLFVVPPKSLEKIVKQALGKHLFSLFKDSSSNNETTFQANREAVNWYVEKIEAELEKQKQAAFFQGIFWLHEMAMKQSRVNPNHSPIPQLSDFDFSLYAKVLRLFLEFACSQNLGGKD